MKRILIIALTLTMVMVAGIGSASAANSLKQGTLGLNFGSDDDGDFMVFGKYFIDNDLALLGGFGLGIKGADAEGTDVAIALGVRKYLKSDDFAPFIGGLFEFSSTNDGDTEGIALLGQFGAEYFLGKQFSVEGSVSFGYGSSETDTTVGITTTSSKTSTIGTSRSGVSFNFYF